MRTAERPPAYRIVATLGPATAGESTWSALLDAGATSFRLNTSHLAEDEVSGWLERLARFFATRVVRSSTTGNGHRSGPPDPDRAPRPSGIPLPLPADDGIPTSAAVPVVLDLQGSKWRIGECAFRILEDGERVTFTQGPVGPVAATVRPADAPAGSVPCVLVVAHPDFFEVARSSDGVVLINDGRVLVELDGRADAEGLSGVVRRGGPISSRKGITIPSAEFRSEGFAPKDLGIVRTSSVYPFVEYAVSYVRDAVEMERYRNTLPAGHRIVAKVERAPAVESIDAIADAADELWLCRGDLGAEIGIAAMARTVRGIEHRLHGGGPEGLPVPVLLAGQVLEHMVEHPEPTRAEVCQLFDAHEAGYAGVVLSDETAVGKFAVESVENAALFR